MNNTEIVVNSLGLFLTNEVNINSNLDEENLVITYNACVLPLILELAVLIVVDTIQEKPMDRFVSGFAEDDQIRRKFVIN